MPMETPGTPQPATPQSGVPQPYGKSIRTQKPLGGKFPAPLLLTLTAVSLTRDLELRASTWKMSITGSIPQTEAVLLGLARGGAPTGDARLVSSSLDGLVFDEASYYTLVIDVPGWKFCGEDAYASYDPFVFFHEKEEMIDGKPVATKKQPNWSFFNAEMIQVAGSNAVRCINFCKETGSDKPLPAKARSPFGFNIYLAVPIAGRQARDGRSVVVIDPTGENKGPNG
jgi:hypothetical protein